MGWGRREGEGERVRANIDFESIDKRRRKAGDAGEGWRKGMKGSIANPLRSRDGVSTPN